MATIIKAIIGILFSFSFMLSPDPLWQVGFGFLHDDPFFCASFLACKRS